MSGPCLRRRLLVGATGLAALLAGCGEKPTPTTPKAVIEAWVSALNDQSWDQACDMSVGTKPDCEAQLRTNAEDLGLPLRFKRAIYGGAKPNEKWYSVKGRYRGVVMFAGVVPKGDELAVKPAALGYAYRCDAPTPLCDE